MQQPASGNFSNDPPADQESEAESANSRKGSDPGNVRETQHGYEEDDEANFENDRACHNPPPPKFCGILQNMCVFQLFCRHRWVPFQAWMFWMPVEVTKTKVTITQFIGKPFGRNGMAKRSGECPHGGAQGGTRGGLTQTASTVGDTSITSSAARKLHADRRPFEGSCG